MSGGPIDRRLADWQFALQSPERWGWRTRVGNLISDVRYWAWRLRGGKFTDETAEAVSDGLVELRALRNTTARPFYINAWTGTTTGTGTVPPPESDSLGGREAANSQ